jgi:hypothetical protein
VKAHNPPAVPAHHDRGRRAIRKRNDLRLAHVSRPVTDPGEARPWHAGLLAAPHPGRPGLRGRRLRPPGAPAALRPPRRPPVAARAARKGCRPASGTDCARRAPRAVRNRSRGPCAAARRAVPLHILPMWHPGHRRRGPNGTVNAWGGPTYLGAIAFHYLDGILLIAAAGWLLDLILLPDRQQDQGAPGDQNGATAPADSAASDAIASSSNISRSAGPSASGASAAPPIAASAAPSSPPAAGSAA